jgi:hypothetical protein
VFGLFVPSGATSLLGLPSAANQEDLKRPVSTGEMAVLLSLRGHDRLLLQTIQRLLQVTLQVASSGEPWHQAPLAVILLAISALLL